VSHKKSKTLNISANFHLVIKVNEEIDLKDFLQNSTEWLGEPKNSDGVVISMILKTFQDIKHNDTISVKTKNKKIKKNNFYLDSLK